MTQVDTFVETYRHEISTLLRLHQGNIGKVFIYYKKVLGRKIYEILKEPIFLTSWLMEERVRIGIYSFTPRTDIIVFVGRDSRDIYYRPIPSLKDKNV